MALTFVDKLTKVSFNSGTSAQSGAFGTNINTGDGIYVGIASFAVSTAASNPVQDTLGNVYSLLGSELVGNGKVYIYGTVATVGGASNKVTVSLAATAQGASFGVARFTGEDSSNTLDGSAVVNSGNTNTASIASWTTANANDLLLIAMFGTAAGTDSAYTPPTGFTDIGQEVNGNSFTHFDFAYDIVSATQSGITPTWSSFNSVQNWVSVGVAVKQASAVTGNLFRTPLLNGLGAGGPFFSNPLGRTPDFDSAPMPARESRFTRRGDIYVPESKLLIPGART